jgi:hypothetical protein
VIAVVLATVVASTIASGRVAPPARQVDSALLTRIAAPGAVAAALVPSPSAARSARVTAISDFPVAAPSAAARPAPDMPQPVGVVVVPTPTPPRARATGSGTSGGGGGGGSGGGGPVGSGNSVSGTASWYCQPGVSACHYQYPGGYYAAAGPALRVGDWRGRAVRVCGAGGCVTVRLIDWCQCYGTRVIDLYSDAFRAIAPLSSGTTRVTVSW